MKKVLILVLMSAPFIACAFALSSGPLLVASLACLLVVSVAEAFK